MKRMIMVCIIPLIRSLLKNYHLGYLMENGVDVQYWDISEIYYHDIKLPETIKAGYVRTFSTFKSLREATKKEPKNNTYFLIQVTYSTDMVSLFRLFSKYGCKTIYFDTPGLPLLPVVPLRRLWLKDRQLSHVILLHVRNGITIQIITQKLRQLYRLVHEYLLSLKSRMYLKLRLVKPFDVAFTVGSQCNRKCVTKIPINHFDYDAVLATQNIDENIIPDKYCVFIDDYLPYHQDASMYNIQHVEPSAYFDSLNRFFRRIESEKKLKVVIAAHPKSEYNLSVFENRLCVKGKTRELVKSSEFVLAHMSTAISFAVIYKKPILFTYTAGMELIYAKSYIPYMRFVANMLGQPVLNLDALGKEEIVILQINAKRYNNYLYQNLASKESKEKLSQESVLAFFKS